MPTKLWSENLNGGEHSEDLGVDERIILDFILGRQGEKLWALFTSLTIGTIGRFF
jgi:hypothetical protein